MVLGLLEAIGALEFPRAEAVGRDWGLSVHAWLFPEVWLTQGSPKCHIL